MITKLSSDTKLIIKENVSEKFNTDIDDDVIDFLQDFQTKIAVSEGFAKKQDVRLFNLAVFKYNEKKVDSKNTMNRLLVKYDGDYKKAIKEFRKLGKDVNIKNRKERKAELASRPEIIKKHTPIVSTDGGFTAV